MPVYEPAVAAIPSLATLPDAEAVSRHLCLYEHALQVCPALFALLGNRTFASRDIDLLLNKAFTWSKQSLSGGLWSRLCGQSVALSNRSIRRCRVGEPANSWVSGCRRKECLCVNCS